MRGRLEGDRVAHNRALVTSAITKRMSRTGRSGDLGESGQGTRGPTAFPRASHRQRTVRRPTA
jgi:hypothetical protein